MTLATRTALLLSGIFTVVFGVAVWLSLQFFEARYVALAGRHQLTTLQGYAESIEGKINNLWNAAQRDAWRRIVDDAANDVGKRVRLEVDTGEIALDRRVLDGLRDPMVHLLRNAVDHGIEPLDGGAVTLTGAGSWHVRGRRRWTLATTDKGGRRQASQTAQHQSTRYHSGNIPTERGRLSIYHACPSIAKECAVGSAAIYRERVESSET